MTAWRNKQLRNQYLSMVVESADKLLGVGLNLLKCNQIGRSIVGFPMEPTI